MNDNLAADHAWRQCKAELEPQKWTIGEHGMFYGFFLNGWSARAAWDSHKASECQRLANEAGRLRAENERLKIDCENHKRIRENHVQANHAAQEECAQLRAENERLKDSVELMRECIGSAVNSFEGIRGESQFCDSCQAFERATWWLNDWHGGERALLPNA